MTVSYSINGVPISEDNLKNVQITRKDYIDYVETIKNTYSNFNLVQNYEKDVEIA